jgi:hypothetical protein
MPKRTTTFLVSVFLLAAAAGFFPQTSQAGLEWRIIKNLDFTATPLGVASSPDGRRLFILTMGEILIHSLPEGTLTDRIPVGQEFDRITALVQPDRIVVSSSGKKSLQVILLETVHQFDFSGLPFKGKEDAPVIVAVFTDYQ